MLCKKGHPESVQLTFHTDNVVTLLPIAGTYCIVCFLEDHSIEKYKVTND
jgi:hypothetical protein